PYVGLPRDLQERLVTYYMERLEAYRPVDTSRFVEAYRYCAVNRNLQILGAFAFLSRVKGKAAFQRYIPAAVSALKQNLKALPTASCRRLNEVVARL
ncbi:MAG: aminoglycoside phosphotransferase, partial [Deltaproteobacteria bacterium]|nr:aminoglycoside phosphotransferase [Deltaproteobacteria bacterium]